MEKHIQKQKYRKESASKTKLSLIFVLLTTLSLSGQNYFKLAQSTGTLATSTGITAVSQSSGTAATVAQMNDLNFATGVQTTSAVNAWAQVDLGAIYTLTYIDLGARGSTSYMNGRSLQVSTNGTTWTDVVVSITGASTTALVRYTFAAQSVRYIRVYNPAVAAGIVGVSEVVAPEAVSAMIVAAVQGNTASKVVKLPFSFVYNGITYTQFSANSNGLVRLGATAVTTEAANNFTSTANTPKLFAIWDDIATGSLATNGGIRYWITGSIGSRKLIIDFKCNKANTGAATDLNFQVWLYEGSNKIEYVYGSGIALASASIGLGTVNAATQYISVTPGSPASFNYYTSNNAVTAWPGSGVLYSFTPTALTNAETVPSSNHATIENAVGALNWAAVPSGGVTFTISGGISERVPKGLSNTQGAGLIITQTGTAANPIRFVWSGSGTRPILYAGAGASTSNDCVLGIAGGDFITIDGIGIRDTSLNTTNVLRTEIGIALYKKRYSTSLGNDGCNTVIIKNCAIRLTRLPNSYYGDAGGGYPCIGETYYTRGIYALRADPKHTWHYFNYYWVRGKTFYGGIKSNNDVHRNCKFIGNTIDNCSYGIELNDGWWYTGSLTPNNIIAGSNNIIGESGAGNIITNWGPDPTVSQSYVASTYRFSSVFAGIAVTGQKDFTVEHNEIRRAGSEINTGSYVQNYAGILVGMGTNRQNFPMQATGFFAKINNNTIDSIDLRKTTNVKSAFGIVFEQPYYNHGNYVYVTRTSAGNVEIQNNTVNNLKVVSGHIQGISSSRIHYYYFQSTSSYNQYSNMFITSGNTTIKNNNIKNFFQDISATYGGAASGSASGSMVGIYWGNNQKNLFIENNTIGGSGINGLVRGKAANTFYVSHNSIRGIYTNVFFGNTTRNLVRIRKNTIDNIDALGGSATGTNNRNSGMSGIMIWKGAVLNQVDSNTISNCNVFNGTYGGYSDGWNEIGFIFVNGIPRSGSSVVRINDNTISNNSRTGFRYSSSGQGIYAKTSAITAPYYAGVQVKHIYRNTITNITQTANATSTNDYLNYTKLFGIFARGRHAPKDSIFVYDNSISNLSGDVWSYNGTLSTASANNQTYCFSTVGISVHNFLISHIYNNKICGLNTNAAGWAADNNNAVGVLGISIGQSNYGYRYLAKVAAERVYNNFIGDLTAPNLRSRLALNGIHCWGYGFKAAFYHNTIVIGDPAGGTTGRVTSSAPTFAATGILQANYYYNTKSQPTEFINNIVHLNVTTKYLGATGTTTLNSLGGSSMCFRVPYVTALKRVNLGLSTKSTGNVYFINVGEFNYVYGQGYIGRKQNTGAGYIRNCFGYDNAGTTLATSTSGSGYNYLVNDNATPKNFNDKCGKYKAFMQGREKLSFIDINVSNDIIPVPFVGSGSCESNINLAAGNSYAGSANPIANPFAVNKDKYGTTRGTSQVTAGAHENSSVLGTTVYAIDFEYDPICDGVCTGNKTLNVKITAPAGKTLQSTGWKRPRVYFRRIRNNSTISAAQSDDNVMVDSINNKSTGTEGWRYVHASAVSGSDFTFILDESLLKSTITTTPTYTIEYFIIAQTTDATVVDWSNGDLSLTCPNTVILSTYGATAVPSDDDGDVAIDENSIEDNYTIYKGTELTKKTESLNNVTTYTTNNTTAIPVCLGDSAITVGHFTVTATGEPFDDQCVTYKMEVSTNNTFTGIVATRTQTDSVFKYPIMSTSNVFVRISLDCGGTTPANCTSPYITYKGVQCPAITSKPADQNICEGANMTVTAGRAGAVGDADVFLFVDPNGKAYPKVTTAVSSGSTVIGPLDTAQAGNWKIFCSELQNAGLPAQGINQATLVTGEIGGDANAGDGLLFDVREPIKLNSVIVRDAGTDGATTTDFNVQLIDTSGHVLQELTGPASVADNGTATLTLGWWIPPGNNYMLVLAPKAGVDPAGELAVADANFPIVVTNGAVTIQNGISGNDYTNITGNYSYFFSWDIDVYCEGTKDSFNVNIRRIPRIEADLTDTVRICSGDTLMMAPTSATGTSLVYQWQRSATMPGTFTDLTGKTDSILLYPSPTTAQTGYYRLKLTAACGSAVYSDTSVVYVGSVPSSPIVPDVFVCNATGGSVDVVSNKYATYWFEDAKHLSALDSGKIYSIPGVNTHDTLYAFLFDTTSGCYSKPDTAIARIIAFLDIPTTVGVHKANAVCIDDNGWAHWYQTINQKLIFSAQVDTLLLGTNLITSGWNTSSPNYEVLVGIENTRKRLAYNNPGYVTNDSGWNVMQRYWSINTNATDATTDVPARFYFKKNNYSNLNTAPVSMPSMDSMLSYRLPDNYSIASANHGNAPTATIIHHGATVTNNFWNLDTIPTIDSTFVETFKVTGVKELTSGGLGANGLCVTYYHTGPEITVKNKNTVILTNDLTPSITDSTHFGTVGLADSVTRTFKIVNTDPANALTLSGSPRVNITGAGASKFKVLTQPVATIAAGDSVTFKVRYKPTVASVTDSAMVTILSTDCSEASYTFKIKGIAGEAEMEVRGKNVVIVDNQTAVSFTDSTNYGTIDTLSTRTVRFKIKNVGSDTLRLTGTPKAVISGTNAAEFTVLNTLPAKIKAGDSAWLYIRFAPKGVGTRTASVSIANNDANENPYNWNLEGTGRVSCDSFYAPVRVAGTHIGASSYTTPGGWTCYCDNQGRLLLSLKLGGTGAVIPNNGVELKMNNLGATFYTHGTGFVGNYVGWVGLNRTWDVAPTTQPTAKVPVRFYFDNSDVSTINGTLSFNGLNNVTINQMSFYKVTNSAKPKHSPVANLGQSDIKIKLGYGTVSDTSWKLGTIGSSNYSEFLVSSFSGGGGGAAPSGATPLNVNWLNITAKPLYNALIRISWSNTLEQNLTQYQIQRSETGLNFETIGTTTANNLTGIQTYQFDDLTVKPGIKYYYRIKAISLTQPEETSRIVSANLFGKTITGITAIPNPANTDLVVKFNLTTGQNVDYKLIAADGKTVMSGQFIGNTGKLNTSQLSEGIYFLELNHQGETEKIKVVIQH